MRSLTLFRPTFQKLQKVIDSGQYLKEKVLPLCRTRLDFERMDRMMFLLNSIDHVAIDLQSTEVDTQLNKFELLLNELKMSAHYDYKWKQFKLLKSQNELSPKSNQFLTSSKQSTNSSVPSLSQGIFEVELGVRSAEVEKADHPILRESLYFSQLKQIDQYVKIKYPKNAPNFIKDMIRRNTENDMLDKENPLGLPIKAPPLEMLLTINRKFTLELYCRYGYINLKTIRGIKDPQNPSTSPCSYFINGMNVPRPIQKVIFSLCRQEIGLQQPELFILHKLSYIGGRVQELEFLMQLYQEYQAGIDEE